MVKIDFSGVEELKPVPADDYPATFTEFKVIQESKASGQPYVAMTYTISDGEYAGRKLWRNSSLSPKALWAFKQTAIRLGVDPEDFDGDVDVEEMLTPLIGAPCVLDVGIREYQGEDRNEVRNVKSINA